MYLKYETLEKLPVRRPVDRLFPLLSFGYIVRVSI